MNRINEKMSKSVIQQERSDIRALDANVYQNFDVVENLYMPQAQIDRREINFGVSPSMFLTLNALRRNTGNVPYSLQTCSKN